MEIKNISKKIILITITSATLNGCGTDFSTFTQNMTGYSVEAFYSTKTDVVCFTTSSKNQDNISCLPAKMLNTKQLVSNSWTPL